MIQSPIYSLVYLLSQFWDFMLIECPQLANQAAGGNPDFENNVIKFLKHMVDEYEEPS
jgi:hypothetical protein